MSMKSNPVPFAFFGLVIGAFLAWCAPTSAAPGDEHWSAQFGWPGTSNSVLAMAFKPGRIYAAGYASSGLFTSTTLQVWDGNQWSNIGLFTGGTVLIYDLAFVGNDLYAAGIFTNVNGVAARGLARWDGNAWSSVGLVGSALSLAVEGNNLYVGGSFTNAGGVIVTNIASWDGNAWHALGAGLGQPGSSSSYVRALSVSGGVLYAGGSFTNSGSDAVTNLAVWNGSTWSAVGGGVSDPVFGLTWNGTDLYAAGAFTRAGSTPANYIARWNGAQWLALGSGLGAAANSVAVLHDTVCVAGSFTSAGGSNALNFAFWNGSTWSPAGAGLSAAGNRVLATASNVYVGGTFLAAGGGIMSQIASWDGQAWSPIGPAGQMSGLQTTVRSIVSDGADLYAGGSFLYAGQGTNTTRVARYDGTNWHAFGAGLNDTVNRVAVMGTNVYAAGDFTGGAGGPLAYHLARWNGSHWVDLNSTAFSTVSALGVRDNDLFVAGYFGITAADGTASWLTRWDGTNFWTVLAFEPITFTQFHLDGIGFTALAVQDTNLYLSGHFSLGRCDDTLTVCTNCDNVMRFDGTYGRLMGSGLNTNATAIAVFGTNVYFAGPFTNAGGVAANRIAKWDGQSWSAVGGGVVGSGWINALAVLGAHLYAGGTFTNIGDAPARRIARWDGTTWSALGSGTVFSATAGPVLTLAAVGQDLYVGGTFRTAGGKASYYMARWNESLNFDVASLRFSRPAGNPSGSFQTTLTALGVPTYVIDVSTNLPFWTPWATNTITPYDLMDSTAPPGPKRFYRARGQP
jgi:hypothetical protein